MPFPVCFLCLMLVDQDVNSQFLLQHQTKLLSSRTELCGTYFFILGTVLSSGPPAPSDRGHWKTVCSGLQVPPGSPDTPLHKSHVIPHCSPGFPATPLSCQLRENMALGGHELGCQGQQESHNLAIRWCNRNLPYEAICRGSTTICLISKQQQEINRLQLFLSHRAHGKQWAKAGASFSQPRKKMCVVVGKRYLGSYLLS